MPSRPTRQEAMRWITPDSETVSHIVAAVLREEAWWAALRSGKYAQTTVVWADDAAAEQPVITRPIISAETTEAPADLNT